MSYKEIYATILRRNPVARRLQYVEDTYRPEVYEYVLGIVQDVTGLGDIPEDLYEDWEKRIPTLAQKYNKALKRLEKGKIDEAQFQDEVRDAEDEFISYTGVYIPEGSKFVTDLSDGYYMVQATPNLPQTQADKDKFKDEVQYLAGKVDDNETNEMEMHPDDREDVVDFVKRVAPFQQWLGEKLNICLQFYRVNHLPNGWRYLKDQVHFRGGEGYLQFLFGVLNPEGKPVLAIVVRGGDKDGQFDVRHAKDIVEISGDHNDIGPYSELAEEAARFFDIPLSMEETFDGISDEAKAALAYMAEGPFSEGNDTTIEQRALLGVISGINRGPQVYDFNKPVKLASALVAWLGVDVFPREEPILRQIIANDISQAVISLADEFEHEDPTPLFIIADALRIASDKVKKVLRKYAKIASKEKIGFWEDRILFALEDSKEGRRFEVYFHARNRDMALYQLGEAEPVLRQMALIMMQERREDALRWGRDLQGLEELWRFMFGDERGEELAEVVRRHNDGDLPGDGPIYLDNLDRVWMASEDQVPRLLYELGGDYALLAEGQRVYDDWKKFTERIGYGETLLLGHDLAGLIDRDMDEFEDDEPETHWALIDQIAERTGKSLAILRHEYNDEYIAIATSIADDIQRLKWLKIG